jgi:hypothetical protein
VVAVEDLNLAAMGNRKRRLGRALAATPTADTSATGT